MNNTALPLPEAFHLVDLASYNIMDYEPINDFDEIIELAGLTIRYS